MIINIDVDNMVDGMTCTQVDSLFIELFNKIIEEDKELAEKIFKKLQFLISKEE